MLYCKHCSNQIDEQDIYCVRCGMLIEGKKQNINIEVGIEDVEFLRIDEHKKETKNFYIKAVLISLIVIAIFVVFSTIVDNIKYKDKDSHIGNAEENTLPEVSDTVTTARKTNATNKKTTQTTAEKTNTTNKKTTQTTAKTTKPKTTTTKAEPKAYVEVYAETVLSTRGEGSEVHVYPYGDFEYIELQILSDYDSPDSRLMTYYKSEINDYIILGFNAIANPPAYLKITPYNSNDKAGEIMYCDIPTDVSSDYVSGGNSNNTITEVTKYGTIYSAYGNKIDGLSKSFLIDGGAAAYERHDLTHGWHIKAVNEYYDGSSYWYELYDADDGDYYGWVNEANISFY